jgi:hypothetical protein
MGEEHMTLPNMPKASDLVEETVRILQRGLPGGDLDDKAIYRPDVPEFELVEAANDDGG